MSDKSKKKQKFFTQYGKVECTMGIIFIVIGAAAVRYIPIGSLILFIVGGIDIYAAVRDHRDLMANLSKNKTVQPSRNDAVAAASAASERYKKEPEEK